jgi:hypothetical protein
MSNVVILSEALQRNAKHEARLSKISGSFSLADVLGKQSEILRFAQNNNWVGAGFNSTIPALS